MIKRAIIICLVNCCAFLFSQELQFSRNFESLKKNIPAAIINKHSNYFHVLRYNKDVHDLTLERRAKPSAEIIAFTPLKLDSVNADWFNYENLDYIFHEDQHQIYFVFEKTLNFKQELYLKTIDTNGKASGFKLLAALEKENNMSDINFQFKIVNQNQLLVIAIQDYTNGSTKKMAELFDLKTKARLWLKKLPIENSMTGYSTAFTCNGKGDLFYVLIRSELNYYKRKYIDHHQVEVPVFLYPSLELISMMAFDPNINRRMLSVKDLNNINRINLYPNGDLVSLLIHFSKGEEPKSEKVFFLTQQWSKDLSTELYDQITPLSETIDQTLSFYDGTDYKTAADKEFSAIEMNEQHLGDFVLSERKEKNNYKELLLWEWDKKNGLIQNQQLIPRRISYFDERSRIKKMGSTNHLAIYGNCYLVFFENRTNSQKQAKDYQHKDFDKLRSSKSANLVMYSVKKEGEINKSLIYENKGFDYMPLNYQSNLNEFIFYFNHGRQEKFAILKVNPL